MMSFQSLFKGNTGRQLLQKIIGRQFVQFQALRSASGSFEEAKMKLNELNDDPGNETKLKLYALFKQATIGKNTTSKPGALNFVGQVKWTAWHDLGDMTTDDAKQEYVNIVNGLAAAEGLKHRHDAPVQTQNQMEGLVVDMDNKIMTITLNRPDKYNAITRQMYFDIPALLSKAAEDDSVSAVVFTGAGEYYCSGNDLENFKDVTPANMHEKVTEGSEICRRYIESYINFPKPLIAAVNGPAVGIAVTLLPLFDVVFVSDKATFLTPFSKTGQSPEACSSYLFPKVMGYAKACSMLLFNELVDANEAERRGLITKVFPHDTFKSRVEEETEKIRALPVKSLIYSKQLMREPEREHLHKINALECKRLEERWTSEDCMKAIMAFMSKK